MSASGAYLLDGAVIKGTGQPCCVPAGRSTHRYDVDQLTAYGAPPNSDVSWLTISTSLVDGACLRCSCQTLTWRIALRAVWAAALVPLDRN